MIGVFGGSGFYSLLENPEAREIETPYGRPSSKVTVGKIAGRDVAFIARHGERHQYPPHKIPYKANIWAFKELGVSRIIAPSAVGSLKKEIKPGEFLVPDQFVNFTRRDDTFYDNETVHIASHEPYCPELRQLLISAAKTMGLPVHEKGTIVVIQGPRFATHAESGMYRSMGFDIINMTQYPECILAREQEICYANISIVTDYDTGVKDDPAIKPVSIEEVLRVFDQNNEKIKKLIFNIVPKISKERKCICASALQGARL
ncbi:MAG: S-methyl-5'-thioadenosine phosphorylase [Candidatus Aenigmarchaeota archaeon]|nr:S-methyl-5'-thioadenosine phosphorylase [Candidatus Aenigmarchaeota archaeon]